MIKILFICHGNICRSPMAEMILKHMVRERCIDKAFSIASAATSTEEIGSNVHSGTRKKLAEVGIPCEIRKAVQVRGKDYETYDYLIVMDTNNYRNLMWMLGGDPKHKVFRLLDFTKRKGQDIADPWYTRNFDETYDDITEGCEGLLRCLGY